MKNRSITLVLATLLTFLTSCEVVGDIFKTGFWIGIITVFLVVGLIFYVIRKFRS